MGTGRLTAEDHRRSHEQLAASYQALLDGVSLVALGVDLMARAALAEYRADTAEKAVA